MPDIFISKKKDKESPKKEEKEKTSLKENAKKVLEKHEEGGRYSPLSAYCFNPKSVHFETQEEAERVVLLLRRHPITNVGWILITILMLFAPAVLSSFPILDFLPGNYRLVSVLGWYLITTAYVLENFLTWFFNVNIVTDERIIDIDFYNLIYKEVSDANIDKIQDVTYKMGGVVRTIFNYGDVIIQTASELPNFDFLAVPKPDRVAKILQDLRIEEEVEKLEGRVR